jgi:hypothetical protein
MARRRDGESLHLPGTSLLARPRRNGTGEFPELLVQARSSASA